MVTATKERVKSMTDREIAIEIYSTFKALKALEDNLNILKSELIERGYENTRIYTSDAQKEYVTIGTTKNRTVDKKLLGELYNARDDIRARLNQLALTKVLNITVEECMALGIPEAIAIKIVRPRIDVWKIAD